MDVISEFFSSIPDALVALWDFGGGVTGLAVTLGTIALTAALLIGAKVTREKYGWVSATLGGCAAFIVGLWAFGILPSAWIYYMDNSKAVLQDQIIPSRIVLTLPWRDDPFVLFSNFYQVFRDSIVMAETFIAMGAFGALALRIQKEYPRTLAEGEEALPASGGYK